MQLLMQSLKISLENTKLNNLDKTSGKLTIFQFWLMEVPWTRNNESFFYEWCQILYWECKKWTETDLEFWSGVNMGQYTNLGQLIKDKAPWLKLAKKDAFDTSPFRKIDNMLMINSTFIRKFSSDKESWKN